MGIDYHTGHQCCHKQTAECHAKESDKKGELTFPMVRMLLEKEKPVERKVVIKTERINSYFPDTYSTEDIEKIIFQLLDNWKNTQ